MKLESTPKYKDDLLERLRDPRYAEAYLNETLQDPDKRVFLLALRDVAEAQGGMTKFARLTHISREHIYRMLSEKGNPEFATLQTLLNAFDFKFSILSKASDEKAA